MNIVDDRAEPLFSRHWRRHFADEKARSGGPDVTGALVEEIIGFVQVAAGDEGNGMAAGQLDQPRTRLRLDRPISGIAPVRAVEKQRAGERRPIVGEMRLAGAQMHVRDLDYPHGSPRR